MATKTVTITEEAYERLKAHKRDDESFTETVLRLTEADQDVMRGFGMFADDEGFAETAGRTRDDLEDAFAERRKRRDRNQS
ncbi:antitoxin VapB family protein [Natrinema sp. 1APR25-10V2]|uniref:antitoxin VapB family protein n=1 Tax=Natrinema sp. 1APR25-10V2 TaxID=2951081 RepID=UPI002876252E|nr:antitoxin VapB family protein [Natrinema sp. 1APR25-10V2]MDS0475764.1 antitoxin VapB family protein [Natrinema sp. 1APR25-10V2]